MATPRVSDALRWEMPRLVSKPNNYAGQPKNTDSSFFSYVESWEPWPEFQRTALGTIFARELSKPYRASRRPPPALERDCVISSEDTVTAAYYYFVWPIVNNCLDSQHNRPHYSAGSRYSQTADWLCVRGADTICLVGDTKIDYKWKHSMLDLLTGDIHDSRVFLEWQNVVGQIQGYANKNRTRYGLCVTDGGVTVFRFRYVQIFASEVATRSHDVNQSYTPGHQRGLSDISMTTSGTAETFSSGSEFTPENPAHCEYGNPQYAFIPWRQPNSNGLTPTEACFFLALMAANGDSYPSLYYPRLDSFRLQEDGSYIHNTSGRILKALPKGAVHEEPNVTEAFAAATVQVQEEQDYTLTEETESGKDYTEESFAEIDGGEARYDIGDMSRESPTTADNYGEGPSEIPLRIATHEQNSARGKDMAPEITPVIIKKRMFGRGLYFVTPSGREVDTDRPEWKKVSGGYELRGRHHIYFTKSLQPK